MFVAGIDAHTRYVVIAVVSKAGELVQRPVRVPMGDPARLRATLAPYQPVEAVVETSSSWPWLHDVLTEAGIGFVLAHAKRLRAIAEGTYKRDEIDAELLARMRLAGLIPATYPTPVWQREWATLIRHRATLSVERTALVNRIHAQLHLVGRSLARGRLLTRGGQQWLRQDVWPQLLPEARRLVRGYGRLITQLTRQLRALDRHIAQVAPTLPEARLRMTVPGLGSYRALLLCAELLPITRFATPGHVVSYAGLAPRSTRSGERALRYGPIPAGANRWVRGTLVRAVVTHVRYAPVSWLTQYYRAQKARLGWPVARIAAARKLARALHSMLRTTAPWQDTPGRGDLLITHAAQTA